MAEDDEPIDTTGRIRDRDAEPDGPPLGFELVEPLDCTELCRHPNTKLDLRARTIECRACGQRLDPWHVLETFGQRYREGWRSKGVRLGKLRHEQAVKGGSVTEIGS